MVHLPNNALARRRQHRHPAKEKDSALSPKARRQKPGNINSCKGANGVGVKTMHVSVEEMHGITVA